MMTEEGNFKMRNLMWPSYGSMQWITMADHNAYCDTEDVFALLGCESLLTMDLVDEPLSNATADRSAVPSLLTQTLAVTAQRIAA